MWTGQGSPFILPGCKNKTRIPFSWEKPTSYIIFINRALFCLPRVIFSISKGYENILYFLIKTLDSCLLKDKRIHFPLLIVTNDHKLSCLKHKWIPSQFRRWDLWNRSLWASTKVLAFSLGECLCLFQLPEAAPSLDSQPSFIFKTSNCIIPTSASVAHLPWLSCFPSFTCNGLCHDLETIWKSGWSPITRSLITPAQSPLPWEVLYFHVPGIRTWTRKLRPRICLYCRGQPALPPACFSLLCPVHTTFPPWRWPVNILRDTLDH